MQRHVCHFAHRTIVGSTHLLLTLKRFLHRGHENGLWLPIAWGPKPTLPLTSFWIFKLRVRS